MQKCDNGHREIVYDEGERSPIGQLEICPLCEAIEEIRVLKEQISKFMQRYGGRRTR
jgi:hypothetical protein